MGGTVARPHDAGDNRSSEAEPVAEVFDLGRASLMLKSFYGRGSWPQGGPTFLSAV